MTVEKRFVNFTSTEIRAKTDSRTVEGVAIVFNKDSVDLGGFTERVLPSAVTQELLDNSDVFAKLNHKDDYILARSKNGQGSLHLELKDDGLHYRFEAPNTAKGDELLEHIRRGEITASSFAFAIAANDEDDHWFRDNEGNVHREIRKIAYLGDVSPVFTPAYEATECSLRSYEAFMKEQIELREAEQEEKPVDEEPKDEAPIEESEESKNTEDTSDEEDTKLSEEVKEDSEGDSEGDEAPDKEETLRELEKIRTEIESW